MSRIIDYSDTAMTTTRMLSLKIGTKRVDHTLPHSHKKKRRIKWNVDKLMLTVDGRKQILCQVSGTGGKCASMSSQQKLGPANTRIVGWEQEWNQGAGLGANSVLGLIGARSGRLCGLGACYGSIPPQ